MTALDTLNTDIHAAHVEPKRDRWGRYLIQPAGGGKAVGHTRATTLAEVLDDRYNLELWKMRQVAVGLTRRPDLLAKVAADEADKTTVNAACKEAMDAAEAGAAATMGTALHRILERLDTCELDLGDVPAMFRDVAAAHLAALTDHGITIVGDWCERVHVLTALDEPIAGMADNHAIVDGRRYILDKKTGSGIDYGARGFAVQLAIYAHAETVYDYATDTHEPMPPIDRERAIIEHVPAKGGPVQFHWIDIAAGWEALEHSLWARKWRKRRDLLAPFAGTDSHPPGADVPVEPLSEGTGTATTPPTAAPAANTTAAWIIDRYNALLRHADIPATAVARRWPDGLPPPLHAERMNTHQRQLANDTLTLLEDEYGAPFPPVDPEAPAYEPRQPIPERPAAEPTPLREPFDDSARVTREDCAALRARLTGETDAEQQSRIKGWLTEAATANRPWNMGRSLSARRHAVSAAALELVQSSTDDAHARSIIAAVIGDDDAQTHPVGALLGTLSAAEATDVAEVARTTNHKETTTS